MTALTWTESLALNNAQMDRTHEEFVDLLAACHAALAGPDDILLGAFDTLTQHTVEHFAQEDRWMAATGFAPANCHAYQHQAVLGVMQECVKRARGSDDAAPDFEPLRLAVGELAIWFPQHAQSMDAALAQHLDSLQFDTATGQCARPVPAEAMTGCGGSSCS
jgi:hemerythrin-like metal-binding protein